MSADQKVAERLRKARELARFSTAAEAAAAIGVGKPAYNHHENGTRGLSRGADERYAKAFKVNLLWLRTGRGPIRGSAQIPILAYVGAGAEVFPIDDHAQGASLDTVDASLPDPAVALIIRGDSQHPLQDGWVIVYARDFDGVQDNCIGKLCVAKVHDGPTLLKTVRRGKSAKTFDLESWNAPLKEGVRLDWAAPVLMIRPK